MYVPGVRVSPKRKTAGQNPDSDSRPLVMRSIIQNNVAVGGRGAVKGDTVDSEHLSEITEEEYDVNFVKPHLKGFVKIDAKYLIPFFTRRFTQQVALTGD